MRKFVGKRRFWSYKVWKVEVSHELLALRLQHVSSRFSGFLVASPCRCGKLQNLSFSNVSKQVLMSFCVAGVARRDILTCLQMVSKVVFCDRRNTFASFSEDELHLSWLAQNVEHVHLHFAWQVQHFRRVVLHACLWWIALSGLCEVVTTCKLRGRRGTSWKCHFAWQGDSADLLSVECHFAWQAQYYLGHSTLYTLHSTLYMWHSTLHTLHSALYTLHFTLYTPHSTLYAIRFTFTFHTPQSPLYTPHATCPTQHSFSSHSALCTLLHSTFQSRARWYGKRGKMYKTVQTTCFTKLFCVTAFGFVGCILILNG